MGMGGGGGGGGGFSNAKGGMPIMMMLCVGGFLFVKMFNKPRQTQYVGPV
jgi:hypothetical protein